MGSKLVDENARLDHSNESCSAILPCEAVCYQCSTVSSDVVDKTLKCDFAGALSI